MLDQLTATGSRDELSFETPSELAVVRFDGQSILDVKHYDKIERQEKIIPATKSKHIIVGEGNAQRDVYHFLCPNPSKHLQLRLGLTVHRGEGTWSSLPHPFELKPELGFEELFFYLLEGASKRAIQVGSGVWHDGTPIEGCWPIVDRTFGVIPMGYHPVVGEPGVQVRYIWAYLVKKPEWEKI